MPNNSIGDFKKQLKQHDVYEILIKKKAKNSMEFIENLLSNYLDNGTYYLDIIIV